MASKKKENGLKKIHNFLNEYRFVRVLAIVGIIVLSYYYALVIFTEEAFLQGVADWGIDQGVSAFLWGIVLLIFSVILITYPLQKKYRSKDADSLYILLVSYPIGFLIYIMFFWQWFSHLPFFNFYHVGDPLVITFGDKVLHFLVAMIMVLIGVAWKPKKTTILIVFLLTISFELFEVIFIVNFSGLYEINYQIIPLLETLIVEIQSLVQVLIPVIDVQEQIIHELIDIVPDMIANSLGIFVGYIFTRKAIAKAEAKEKKKRRK